MDHEVVNSFGKLMLTKEEKEDIVLAAGVESNFMREGEVSCFKNIIG